MAYKGVDLTHPQWPLARATLGTDPNQRLVPVDGAPADDWPTVSVGDASRPFWELLEQKLAVEPPGSEPPGLAQDALRPVFENEKTRLDREVFGNEKLGDLWVALAIPGRTPPLLRKNLHSVFSPRSLHHHAMDKRAAVEASVALTLEGVARNALRPGSATPALVLTGSHPTLELTAVGLSFAEGTLQLRLSDYAAVDPADVAGSLRGFTPVAADTPLVHGGNPEAAELVASALRTAPGAGRAPVIDLGRHAAAVGALRYCGLHARSKQRWLGPRITELEVEYSLPMATGVLGTNRAGEWYWRRLLNRGDRIPSSRTRSDLIARAAPERLLLADCPCATSAERLWLPAKDWASAGLRWHDVISGPPGTEPWELRYGLSPSTRLWNRLPHLRWEVVTADRPQTATASPRPPGEPLPEVGP